MTQLSNSTSPRSRDGECAPKSTLARINIPEFGLPRSELSLDFGTRIFSLRRIGSGEPPVQIPVHESHVAALRETLACIPRIRGRSQEHRVKLSVLLNNLEDALVEGSRLDLLERNSRVAPHAAIRLIRQVEEWGTNPARTLSEVGCPLEYLAGIDSLLAYRKTPKFTEIRPKLEALGITTLFLDRNERRMVWREAGAIGVLLERANDRHQSWQQHLKTLSLESALGSRSNKLGSLAAQLKTLFPARVALPPRKQTPVLPSKDWERTNEAIAAVVEDPAPPSDTEKSVWMALGEEQCLPYYAQGMQFLVSGGSLSGLRDQLDGVSVSTPSLVAVIGRSYRAASALIDQKILGVLTKHEACSNRELSMVALALEGRSLREIAAVPTVGTPSHEVVRKALERLRENFPALGRVLQSRRELPPWKAEEFHEALCSLHRVDALLLDSSTKARIIEACWSSTIPHHHAVESARHLQDLYACEEFVELHHQTRELLIATAIQMPSFFYPSRAKEFARRCRQFEESLEALGLDRNSPISRLFLLSGEEQEFDQRLNRLQDMLRSIMSRAELDGFRQQFRSFFQQNGLSSSLLWQNESSVDANFDTVYVRIANQIRQRNTGS